MARKDLIKSHVDVFLRQHSDHEWLIKSCNGGMGSDMFKNTIVYSTFSDSLNRDDFAYFIDTTFSDVKDELRIRMKGLFITNQHSYRSEDVVFDYGLGGHITTSLIQILSQKNDQNELEVLFGFISLTRKPSISYHFNPDYWKSDQDRVLRGLQYIFGSEAQKEIAHK